MATLQVRTTWVGMTDPVLTAQRAGQTLAQWAAEHVDQLMEGEQSTEAASGSGSPLEHTIQFQFPGGPVREAVVTKYGTQQELDAAVAALKTALQAEGATIISG